VNRCGNKKYKESAWLPPTTFTLEALHAYAFSALTINTLYITMSPPGNLPYSSRFFFFFLAATVVDSGKAALNMYTYISASVLDHFFHFCSPVTDFFIFPFFSLSLLFFLRFSVDCQSPYSSHFILFLPPLLSFFCIFPFLVRLQ